MSDELEDEDLTGGWPWSTPRIGGTDEVICDESEEDLLQLLQPLQRDRVRTRNKILIAVNNHNNLLYALRALLKEPGLKGKDTPAVKSAKEALRQVRKGGIHWLP